MTTDSSFTSPLFRSPECFYQGRAGYGYCTGLHLSVRRRLGQTIVRLSPVNTRRVTGSCFLEFPLATLPELISFLEEFYHVAERGLDSSV